MGYAAPVTLCGRLLMRKVILHTGEMEKKLGMIHCLEIGKWYLFLRSIFQLENLHTRYIRNISFTEPSLIIFPDAIARAYSACAFARWQVDEGNYES